MINAILRRSSLPKRGSYSHAHHPYCLNSCHIASSPVTTMRENTGIITEKSWAPSHSNTFSNETAWNNLNKKMLHTTAVHHHKLSVAIVGSGPSGFYSAKYLQLAIERAKVKEDNGNDTISTTIDNDSTNSKSSTINAIEQVHIDLIDRLPTPYGLVRSGVAPDHPEVKNVENDFKSVIQRSNTLDNENDEAKKIQTLMEFRGNVHIGKDVSLQELRDLYDIVILAYGCESDKQLGIEVAMKNQNDDDKPTSPQRLDGIYSAREFVAWYNGHPDFAHFGDSFQKALKDGHPENAEVVVIGQGNVALDCARILAKGQKNLIDTDIAAHSLPILKDGVKNTTVIGRRGHVQGSFTIKELRELTKLEKEGCDTHFRIMEEELNAGLTEASFEELKKSRPKTRINKLLHDVAVTSLPSSSHKGEGKIRNTCSKQITLRFMLNPVKFIPDSSDETKLGSILCEICELRGEPFEQVAAGTGKMEEIPANMVLVSIGYKGIPLPGMDSSIFDEKKGIVKNKHGRVCSDDSENDYDKDINGLYVSGWLKRGPSGIIGTNITDAKDTVASIMEDILTEKIRCSSDIDMDRGRDGLDKLLIKRNVKKVDWSSYEEIDRKEKNPTRLRSEKQPREKIVSVESMLALVS